MNTGAKTGLGFLAGIAAGFCLGLLVAPAKGSRNRKKITKAASEWTMKLRNLFSADHKPQRRVKRKITGTRAYATVHSSRSKNNHR